MNQAINAYYTITASSEFRERERLRAKARHDEAQSLYNAKREERIEIALAMYQDGLPIETIAKYLRTTTAEIEEIINEQKLLV